MQSPQPTLKEIFLKKLCGYNTSEVPLLVMETLGEWGAIMAHNEVGPTIDRRDPKVYQTLLRPASDFLIALQPREIEVGEPRKYKEGKRLGVSEIKEEARKWSEELFNLPYDETIRSFTQAVDDWRYSYYAVQLLNRGYTLQKAKESADFMHRWWALDMGLM